MDYSLFGDGLVIPKSKCDQDKCVCLWMKGLVSQCQKMFQGLSSLEENLEMENQEFGKMEVDMENGSVVVTYVVNLILIHWK